MVQSSLTKRKKSQWPLLALLLGSRLPWHAFPMLLLPWIRHLLNVRFVLSQLLLKTAVGFICYTTDIVPCSCLNEICDISNFCTQTVEKRECFLILYITQDTTSQKD